MPYLVQIVGSASQSMLTKEPLCTAAACHTCSKAWLLGLSLWSVGKILICHSGRTYSLGWSSPWAVVSGQVWPEGGDDRREGN